MAGDGGLSMSTAETDEEEALAVWAFEAAMNGLPEDEARVLLESDRYPEPDAEPVQTVESVSVTDGRFVLYDPDEERAWIQSDTAVDLTESR
jgi:hypothetical protein